jgi:hypothetical protein
MDRDLYSRILEKVENPQAKFGDPYLRYLHRLVHDPQANLVERKHAREVLRKFAEVVAERPKAPLHRAVFWSLQRWLPTSQNMEEEALEHILRSRGCELSDLLEMEVWRNQQLGLEHLLPSWVRTNYDSVLKKFLRNLSQGWEKEPPAAYLSLEDSETGKELEGFGLLSDLTKLTAYLLLDEYPMKEEEKQSRILIHWGMTQAFTRDISRWIAENFQSIPVLL